MLCNFVPLIAWLAVYFHTLGMHAASVKLLQIITKSYEL